MLALCNELIPAFDAKPGNELFDAVDALGAMYYGPDGEGREDDKRSFKRAFGCDSDDEELDSPKEAKRARVE